MKKLLPKKLLLKKKIKMNKKSRTQKGAAFAMLFFSQ
jgi:hypothetical protein